MSAVGMTGFPFSAVVGMDDAKRAIECAIVNPRIRTVLIRGGPGSAKTVLARAAGSLFGRTLVNVPLNVTEEQLFGGMDIDATIREGRPVVQKGLLARADGGMLYVDDINLLDQRVLASLLDCVYTGNVILEREGVSAEYGCDTILIATMDPSDSDISPHLLDRFDLCAYSDFPDAEDGRSEILRRTLSYGSDPASFRSMYSDDDASVRADVERASRLLPLVTVSDDLLAVAVELVGRVLADGYRGDLSLINAAMALAALNGRDEVMRKDLEEAAMICLAHRRNFVPEPPEMNDDRPDDDDGDEDDGDDDDRDDDRNDRRDDDRRDDDPGDDDDEPPEDDDDGDPEPPDIQGMLDDMMFEIGEQFRVIDYLEDGRRTVRRTSSRKGRRAMVESSDRTGRYARSRQTDGRAHDIAFDATVRAAAPYQSSRVHDGLSVSICPQDIREKVRERRSGCTIMFLVDASGSLGVRKRMTAVKGAVMSMLRDSYVKRDRIGIMAFRRDSAELILPPTKSVEYSYRRLEEMPTGGKTPLGEALVTVSEFMTSYSRSHQGEICHVVLITDGRANVPLSAGADANEEVIRLASDISIPQVRWIVIDASAGYIRFDNAERLAMALEGTYLRLEDLNADRLAETVRAAIRR
ncbi:MAG: VWA domain-containing protein [Candidatus Methanomethylophilaceae archaeon]